MPEFGGVLRGERLSLREFTVDDAGAVHAAYGDPTVTANFGISPFDAASVAGFLDHAARQATARPRTEYLLAVTGPGGDVLGCAHLLRGDHDTAEIGAVLAAERVGRGHSSELGALLFTLGFDLLGLHRIWSAVLPANTAAQRACAKAGMTYEGTLRAHRCYEGRRHDTQIYAILRPEWTARRAALQETGYTPTATC